MVGMSKDEVIVCCMYLNECRREKTERKRKERKKSEWRELYTGSQGPLAQPNSVPVAFIMRKRALS
jgi:hypothetical protein